MTATEDAEPLDYDDLPAEHVTIDQVVAANMGRYRRLAGVTQEELGRRLGRSEANANALERSADRGREPRRFDAQMIASIAHALGVPIVALFLPPEDDGTSKRYTWRSADGKERDMTDLMWLAMHDNSDDTPVMNAYRATVAAAVTAYVDQYWGEEVADWFRRIDSAEMRVDRARRLDTSREALLGVAELLGRLAEDMRRPEEEEK